MSFSKTFVKLLYMKIHQHLVDNNILVDKQYGFRINSTVKMTHTLLTYLLTP